MRAALVLAAHTVFNGLVAFIAIAGLYVAALSGLGLAGSIAGGAIIELFALDALWRRYDGCPLSTWEKRLRERDEGSAYEGSCLAHYGRKWLGLSLSEEGARVLSIIVILMPVAGLVISIARETFS